MLLSWLGIVPQVERLPVRFPVRAPAWVVGLVPSWGTYEKELINISLSHQCFSPSLSPFLLLSLKTNKILKIKGEKINGIVKFLIDLTHKGTEICCSWDTSFQCLQDHQFYVQNINSSPKQCRATPDKGNCESQSIPPREPMGGWPYELVMNLN